MNNQEPDLNPTPAETDSAKTNESVRREGSELPVVPYLTVARLAWCSHPRAVKERRLASKTNLIQIIWTV